MRILVEMEGSAEKDVSSSRVHLGIGHPDRSLRPPVSNTWGKIGEFQVYGCRLPAFEIDGRDGAH